MKLYTAVWCNPCQELKQWMKARNIEFTEINAEEIDPEDRKLLGVSVVPTLIHNGEVYKGRENIKPYLGNHMK